MEVSLKVDIDDEAEMFRVLEFPLLPHVKYASRGCYLQGMAVCIINVTSQYGLQVTSSKSGVSEIYQGKIHREGPRLIDFCGSDMR